MKWNIMPSLGKAFCQCILQRIDRNIAQNLDAVHGNTSSEPECPGSIVAWSRNLSAFGKTYNWKNECPKMRKRKNNADFELTNTHIGKDSVRKVKTSTSTQNSNATEAMKCLRKPACRFSILQDCFCKLEKDHLILQVSWFICSVTAMT